MNKTYFIAGAFFLSLFLNSHAALAHQPQYVSSETTVQIPDAETSRAYYAELTGEPAIYTLTSEEEFTLYVNVLSPFIPDAKKDFAVQITNENGAEIANLSTPAAEWQQWDEEFAGDTYWKGPEFKQMQPAGTYTIEVRNPGNTGKYILAPGEAEIFTLAGTPETIQQLYSVKTLFFEKPWYSIFEGIIGKMLLVFLLLISIFAAFIIWLIYKKIHKKP